MTKTKKIVIAVCLAIVVLAGAFFAWQKLGGGTGTTEDAVYMQKISDLNNFGFSMDRYSGVIEAQKTQSFKRDAERTIEEVYVTVGQEVKEGTPLFRYDVRSTEHSIESTKLDIEGLYNEINVLRGGGNSTEIQLQISERELEIRQKQAELERLEQEIAQSEVLCTLDGVVKAVNPDGGNDGTGSELPIVAVTETGEFRVKGKISEQTIGSIYPGMEVIIRSRVDESQTWPGKIANIETEPANENTGGGFYEESMGERSSSYPFYVTLPSTDGLMLGQHVFIEPDYGQTEVREGLWLDSSFVVTDDNGNTFVWISKNGRMVKKEIEVGDMDEDTMELQIVSGLTPNDYIAWPDEFIEEGMKAQEISEDF